MNEVFAYPQTQPTLWLENYATITWLLSMLILATAWALFFRYGNFKYGIDIGCLVKTVLIIGATTLAFGFPMMYNTKFYAEHAHEGDKVILRDDEIVYETRSGKRKALKYSEIQRIYREPLTYNPPKSYHIIGLIDSIRVDSISVKENLPNFEKFLQQLSEKTNRRIERSI
jgi:hypothetical protein